MFKNIARKSVSKMEPTWNMGLLLRKHEKYLCPSCKSNLNARPNIISRNTVTDADKN